MKSSAVGFYRPHMISKKGSSVRYKQEAQKQIAAKATNGSFLITA
jgi:hypothetical protein